MHGVFPHILTIASMFCGQTLPPVVAPVEFQGWFDAAVQKELVVPGCVAANAAKYRYVFVGGFCNERMPGYFEQNAKELKALGVPKDAIHYIYPSSHETSEENADDVRDGFAEIARKGPEPIVVIAHSRGACDVMAFALNDPAFVQNRIKAMFLVQGPFGGTGLADFVMGDGEPMDRRMPLRHRVVGKMIVASERTLMAHGKHGGIPGMTRSASHDFWARTLAEHAAQIPVVAPKTFYIATETRPGRLGVFKKATGQYLQTYFGPNDGMVMPVDQSLPGVGTVLAVLNVGHTDLTNHFPSARAQRGLRRALIDGIVMAVGRETPVVVSGQAP